MRSFHLVGEGVRKRAHHPRVHPLYHVVFVSASAHATSVVIAEGPRLVRPGNEAPSATPPRPRRLELQLAGHPLDVVERERHDDAPAFLREVADYLLESRDEALDGPFVDRQEEYVAERLALGEDPREV